MSARLNSLAWRGAACLACVLAADSFCSAQPIAFPGAVGQGSMSTGGRGGDVYHVTNLLDYTSSEPAVQGSLRYGIASATGPRTIVFDVGGSLPLARPLSIDKDNLTLAGQTSPTGITVWGYPTSVKGAEDIIVRYMRFRTGDFNVMTANPDGTPTDPIGGNGNMDLLGDAADGINVTGGSNRVILDHLSASWSLDETLSVTVSKNVTVQHSIIAASLNSSLHHKGEHGYGSLVRGEVTAAEQAAGEGGYTFYGDLWAHHDARNPSFGGQQTLEPGQAEADRRRINVNLVNSVVFNWESSPTHRNNDGDVYANIVNNYYVNGPLNSSSRIFKASGPGDTFIWQQGNYNDKDLQPDHDGFLIDTPTEIAAAFQNFEPGDTLNSTGGGTPYNFFSWVEDAVVSAPLAYQRVVDAAGASLWRDVIDQRVLDELASRTGSIINSQDTYRVDGILPGIDDLPFEMRPAGFDTDGDGMPDSYENTIAYLDPNDSSDRNLDINLNGYTDLEDYLNFLVGGPLPTGVAGDYNNNGEVDAADYTAWRDALTAGAADLLNDSTPGTVDESDFTYWRAHFGELFGSGGGQAAAGAVPEPKSLALLLAGGILFCCRRFRCGARATIAG